MHYRTTWWRSDGYQDRWLVASFSGLPTVQFSITLQSANHVYLNSEELTLLPWWCREGRRGSFDHMNDVNVYLGSLRQRGGEGVPGQKSAFLIHVFFIEQWVVSLPSVWNYATRKGLKFSQEHFLSSATKVDIDVIHTIELTRPLPIFVHCKQSTVGRPWNEASWLVYIHVLSNYHCDTGCCVHVVFAKRSKVYLDNSTSLNLGKHLSTND